MILIACDPHANHHDLAVFENGGLLDCVSLKEDTLGIFLAGRFSRDKDLKDWDKYFVVEDQYMIKDLRKKKAIIKLAHAAGEIAGIMKINGYETSYLEPAEWKKSMLTGISVNARINLEFPGFKFKNIHQKEAAFMGLHWLNKRRLEGK